MDTSVTGVPLARHADEALTWKDATLDLRGATVTSVSGATLTGATLTPAASVANVPVHGMSKATICATGPTFAVTAASAL